MTATRKGEDESGGGKKREAAVLTLMAAIPARNSRRAREAGIEDPRSRSVTMGRKGAIQSTTIQNVEGSRRQAMGWSRPCNSGSQGVFARKTKRPRLSLESRASVDQPSPKCCSKTTLPLASGAVNGSLVPGMAPFGDIHNSVKTHLLECGNGATMVLNRFSICLPASSLRPAAPIKDS